MVELLDHRAAVRTILDWRRGRRRPPVLAVEVLQEVLNKRARRETECIDELENEKGSRL